MNEIKFHPTFFFVFNAFHPIISHNGEEMCCGVQIFLDIFVKHKMRSLGSLSFFNRISGFHDTWPNLEKWFGGQQNILVKVTADVDEDDLFSNVKIVLMDTMDSAEKGIFT